MKTFFQKPLGIIFVIIMILTLVSCDFDESNNHLFGGEFLDDAKMSEIRDEVISELLHNSEISESDIVEYSSDFSETDNESETNNIDESIDSDETSNDQNTTSEETSTPDTPTISNKETVYWTSSGSVWHISSECRYIRKSTNIINGSIEDAKEAGKTKVCSSCGK